MRLTEKQAELIRMMASFGGLRSDHDGWTIGEKASIASLIRRGLATENCGRLTLTADGHKAADFVL